jgi:hypothetical protein
MRPCVYVTDHFEETLAAYERLGFQRVRAWDRGADTRSALFRAGPAYVEVVEAAAQPRPRRRAARSVSQTARQAVARDRRRTHGQARTS